MHHSNKTMYDLVVLGSGPGGYAAAFRAADLGLSVALIERYENLGGVCLNVGCIPSKALLHIAGDIRTAQEAKHGVTFLAPKIDLDTVRKHKESTVNKLTGNLALMAKQRNVALYIGEGLFSSEHTIKIHSNDASKDASTDTLTFKHAIIAIGSTAVHLPFIPKDDRVWNSSRALELPYIPNHLVVLGGGIIGLEMATVYEALGAKVTIVEQGNQLIPGADADQVRVYQKANASRMKFKTHTKMTKVDPSGETLKLTLTTETGEETLEADALLVAVGRKPNGFNAGIPEINIDVDDRGFIVTDDKCRTSINHIFAIGDVTHGPMLAHKASHEGHVAAEVVAGHLAHFSPLGIPSIAYTYPEVAWVGLTETQAKAQDIKYKVATFPWSASGRAIASGQTNGATKLIYEPEHHRLLGAGLVGAHAGELLGELTLALEYGATLEDIALTIHAHPSLHESIGLAAELGTGTITDFPNPFAKRRK
ncbi:dihydrolipoyl dehydrogenase [Marinomonas mediterranea]|uniref:Dihydrolipoyl dehydrogenase n=1 Tax=Marinomonas mediterranea (strain ATCC 700492 / JCM 21426 / NBRC 103028 / MMB-1) TaxID=717774 RepID=F2JVB5_MARM1|nr:dihydrolipoyl dehydrogenase [Marinomonas mediterranea]ADZ89373.1 dihydrolipoamide dehydrogenase [Marinomonas mediterranea MMB-1]